MKLSYDYHNAAAHAAFEPVLNVLDLHHPLQRIEIDDWNIDLTTLMQSSGRIDVFNEEEWLLFGVSSGPETGEVCEQAGFEWHNEDGFLQGVSYAHISPKSQVLRKEQV
ncbi:hypothetical protein AB838_06130 [Rhodobacteraceae bacterium (ex Bugula neritina AB1)]|nr:hypothetical protein AB838_06130 [Rhodobacteraceae bacterium (ex Bugula neritina AB1)]